MDRLEQLRQVIDEIVRGNPDPEESRCGFVHLYGVSAVCGLLALKRGLDPEICSVAGMLHDIWNYKVGDCPEHAQAGAQEAEKILNTLGPFSQEEIRDVCEAVALHGDKQSIHGEMAELLKDADVFQHYLYNPRIFQSASRSNAAGRARAQRLEKVLVELGLTRLQ